MKYEILAPAGDSEKLKAAIEYGADAVYFAGKKYGLRAYAGNFDNDELKEQINYIHSKDKKAYITLNILAHNADFAELKNYINYLEKIKVDAVIVADLGICRFIKEHSELEIHISTQANITNKYSAKAFVDMGAKRLILARELTIEEIKEIYDYLPKEIDLETFVHGAMCMAYSGRCLISNYLTGRDSNRGECAQSCRWKYTVTESKRESDPLEITEDSRGTYIFNSKDLNMINHLDKLAKAGVKTFKIEGRMKSSYYVATVVNAYRRAVDILEEDINSFKVPSIIGEELYKTSHRKFSTGFYFKNEEKNYIKESMPESTHKFMGCVLNNSEDGYVLVQQRNKIEIGDKLEVLSNTNNFNKSLIVTEMKDEEGRKISVANIVKQNILIKTDLSLTEGDMLRKVKI